jgi:hypothetical protein
MVDTIIESLDQDELAHLRDACNRRLLRLRRTEVLTLSELLRLLEAVKTTLRDQDKEWHSLERWQWIDGQIRFWLNPIDQTHYHMGWFGIDDLIAWTEDQGPIVIAAAWDVDEQEEAALVQHTMMQWADIDTVLRSR